MRWRLSHQASRRTLASCSRGEGAGGCGGRWPPLRQGARAGKPLILVVSNAAGQGRHLCYDILAEPGDLSIQLEVQASVGVKLVSANREGELALGTFHQHGGNACCGSGYGSCFIRRQPPARLLAMICRNMAVSAGRLIGSPRRNETVRAVLLSWPAVMMPSGSGTMPPS